MTVGPSHLCTIHYCMALYGALRRHPSQSCGFEHTQDHVIIERLLHCFLDRTQLTQNPQHSCYALWSKFKKCPRSTIASGCLIQCQANIGLRRTFSMERTVTSMQSRRLWLYCSFGYFYQCCSIIDSVFFYFFQLVIFILSLCELVSYFIIFICIVCGVDFF